MYAFIILVIPVILVLIFLLVYRLLRLRPLWMKIFVAFSLPIVTIIVAVLVLDIYFLGFTDARKCTDEKGFFRKLFCGISETYQDNAPYFRSLPSDEEMIEHFYRHRADFERLVKIYLEDSSVPTDVVGTLLPTPEVKATMDRINITFVSDDQVLWILPDPYSTDPDFRRKYIKLSAKTYGANRREIRQYFGVILSYAHPKALRLKYMAPVHKRYYYVPFRPRVRDGEIHFPQVSLMAYGDGPSVQSLNTYPPGLKPFGCAYREIEPHWFIRMYQDRDN